MSEKTARPLSPHLQIYRWQLTMALSILHRVCGAALAVGTVMVVWMLLAAAWGPESYDRFVALCNTKIGKLALFGWSAALFYHMCNGVRHLFWDTGRLFDIKNAYRAGYLVLIVAALLLAWFWGIL